jgi:signal transduction histidine kinase
MPDFNQRPNRISEINGSESDAATARLLLGLVYINILMLIAGGFGSHFLAKRNIEPIKKAHEAQSRFTSDASHELRTPLTVMKTEIEVALNNKNITNEELKEILSSNLEEVNKLSKLSTMLLDLSQLDNSKLEFNNIDLVDITNEVIAEFKQHSNRIFITTNCKPVVYGNETALSNLIKVLIENAIQYSYKKTKIRISISQTNKEATFKIANTGNPISPEKIPFLFDRFYRADESRTKGDYKGYGLGLALAKKIIDLHDGDIYADSDKEKTTFIFRLPINRDLQAKTQN